MSTFALLKIVPGKSLGEKGNKPEVNAGHAVSNLLKSYGDVFGLFVQEYKFLDTFPFKSINPKAGLQKAADLSLLFIPPGYALFFGLLTRTKVFCLNFF